MAQRRCGVTAKSGHRIGCAASHTDTPAALQEQSRSTRTSSCRAVLAPSRQRLCLALREAVRRARQARVVFGRCTVAVAQFKQRYQLQPRCLLRSGLRDRASDRGISGRAVATCARDGSLHREQLRQIYALPERVSHLQRVLEFVLRAIPVAGKYQGLRRIPRTHSSRQHPEPGIVFVRLSNAAIAVARLSCRASAQPRNHRQAVRP